MAMRDDAEGEMAARAYILIEVEVGYVRQVAESIRDIPGVEFADVITGPHDVIACVNAPDMAAVAETVTGGMQGIPGVLKTITCVGSG